MKNKLRSMIFSVIVFSQLNLPVFAQGENAENYDMSYFRMITVPTLVNAMKAVGEQDFDGNTEDVNDEEQRNAAIDDIYFDAESGEFTVDEKYYCNPSMVSHIERLNKNMVDIKIVLDKRTIPLERTVIAEATDINTGAIDYSVIFNWCKEFCRKYCSATTMRAWNGNIINIPGGDGKYKIKEGTTAQELTSKVYTALISFNSEEIKAVKSLPQRYIECDLSAQKIYWYDDGECSMSADCVTGAVNTPTPIGTYTIKNNMGATVLTGPTWYQWVNNWAYFSQGCGLHDASWQKSFGLERWKAGYGSHGCINLPLSIANQLRSKTAVGDIIIIHN